MIEIREGRLGKSVYTTRDLPGGAVVLTGRGTVVPRRTRHSIQVDHNTHVVVAPPIELINHSCEPNCGLIAGRDDYSIEIHTLRPIQAGEELTLDYASWEEEIEFMTGLCLCGTPSCRGRIDGYSTLPPERRAALGPYIAAYLREIDAPVAQAG